MGILDGKVVLVTGGGNGIGRDCALIAAQEGAKVLVNDLGGSLGGEGADSTPAEEVAEEIRAMGLEAAADYENVADFAGAERMVRHAIDALGGLDIQLVHYGGFGDFVASPFLADAASLRARMLEVRCRAGQTQIGRVLDHARGAALTAKVNALVFIGDAVEEEAAALLDKAGARRCT